MNQRARSFPAAVLGVTIAILAIVAPVPRVGAAPASSCTTTAGVTVIVDLTHFGREIERGCAAGHPASALAALHAAGFATAGTAQYGDAFVCRLDGLPKPQAEACAVTPPAQSSWSFYYAHATDAAWTYSSTGVLSYRPPAGTIVALAFGKHAQPGIRPSAAIVGAPPTTTPTTTTPTTAPPPTAAPTSAPVGAQLVAPASPTSTTAAATTATGAGGVTTTAPSTATTGPAAATVASTSTSTPPRVVDRTATGAATNSSSGSPLPAAITVLLVALLGVGAAVTINARGRRAR